MKPFLTLVRLNRALWVLAALVVFCSAATVVYWRWERMLGSSKPLELPPLDKFAARALAAAEPGFPERNPFDLEGRAWRAPAGAKGQRVARLEDVRGVLASRTLSGVFTPAGLVKTGEPFAGGTLEAVNRETLVVRMPDGNTKLLQLAHEDDKVRERLRELWEGAKVR